MSIEEFVMWCIENDCHCFIRPGDHMKVVAVIDVYSNKLDKGTYILWNGEGGPLKVLTEKFACKLGLTEKES